VSPRLSARVGLTHVLRQRNQFLDHLSRLDGAVLVAANGLFQHLGKRARLNHVLAAPCRQLTREQLLEELHGEVPLGHAAHFGEELLGEDRDVRLLQPRRREDVHDALGTIERNH
jgi:hypothetical protein